MAISIARPIQKPIFHPVRIFAGYCDLLLIPACIILVIAIFPLQIRELLSSTNSPIRESSLSPTTLALQTIALALVAWSWKVTIGRPGDPFNITPPGATMPPVLYRLGAWQWVNNLIFALGQGLLLLIYLWVRIRQRRLGEYTRVIDETTHLL